MLKDIIPAKWRSIAYVVYAVLGLILGAVQVGYASAQAGQPVWLTVAFPVFAFLGAGFGFTANANTDTVGRHAADE
jgi:CHASE2 domain-containing sensor protein